MYRSVCIYILIKEDQCVIIFPPCRDVPNAIMILAPDRWSKHFPFCQIITQVEVPVIPSLKMCTCIANILSMMSSITQEVISNAAEIFSRYYESGYTKTQLVKDGLKRLLCDRYRNDVTSFVDRFVHPTQNLLSDLQEQVFVYIYM